MPECFEQGEIGFAGTVMVNTLATADPEALLRASLAQKGIYQRGLANTRLPCHEADLPLSLRGGAPPLLELQQLCRAVDEHRVGGDTTLGGVIRDGR